MTAKICYKSTEINIVSNELIIETNKNLLPNNLECAGLLLVNNIPTETRGRKNSKPGTPPNPPTPPSNPPYPVFLKIDGTNYPVLTKAGNTLMSDQLLTRVGYSMIFGNNEPHFLLNNCNGVKETAFTV